MTLTMTAMLPLQVVLKRVDIVPLSICFLQLQPLPDAVPSSGAVEGRGASSLKIPSLGPTQCPALELWRALVLAA